MAAEGALTLQLKVGAWKRTLKYPTDKAIGLFTFPTAVNLLDTGETTAFIETIRRRELLPSMVVFDTVARCMPGGNENTAQDMGLLISNADRVRTAFDTTVVLVHHMDKQEKYERGSTALRGACDSMMQFTRTDDLLRLSCEKQKDALRFASLNVRMVQSGGGCVLELTNDEAPPRTFSDAQQKAFQSLKSGFTKDGATSAQWQSSLPDVNERTFHRAKKVLIEGGYVSKSGHRFVL